MKQVALSSRSLEPHNGYMVNGWRSRHARWAPVKGAKNQIAEHKSGGKSAVFGNFRFKSRSECPNKPGYPRWFDVDQSGDCIHLEAEIAWVQHAFKLARDMDARRIARELRAMGVTQAENDDPIKEGDFSNLLRSVTVMGWRQHVHNNKPVGQPEKGVYPAIISQTEFDEVQVALKSRNFKTVPNGRHRHNLFVKRTYCASCGRLLGVRNLRNGHAFTCSSKGHDCTAPNIRYDEEALLTVLT